MPTNVMEMLQGQITEEMLEQLSQQIGGAEKEKTATATSAIMTTLLGGLAKNASDPAGARSITNALEKDHDGSVLNNFMDIFNNQKEASNPRALNGGGIVNHILGSRQQGAIEMISKMSGLDSNKTGSLMTMLAPMVMGMLGKQKKQENLSADGIASLLSKTVSQQKNSNPLMDMATQFLDADGDGSIVDDVVGGIGRRFLGNLFGGK